MTGIPETSAAPGTNKTSPPVRRPRFWCNFLIWGSVGLFFSPIYLQSHQSFQAHTLNGEYGQLLLQIFVPAVSLTGLRFAIYKWPNRGWWTQLTVILGFAVFCPFFQTWTVFGYGIFAFAALLFLGRLFDCNLRVHPVNSQQFYVPYLSNLEHPRWLPGRRRELLKQHLQAESDGS
jgi:hypothetical protein